MNIFKVYGKIITYNHMPRMPGQNHNAGNNVHVCSLDETIENENGELYNNNHDMQDQNSSCDPTVSSTIVDDLKEDDRPLNISPIDIYSRSPSKEQDSKNKREWSDSSDEKDVKLKKCRVSGSQNDDRRKPRSPPIQSPRISRPNNSDLEDETVTAEHFNNSSGLSSTFCPLSPSMEVRTEGNGIDDDSNELEPILSDEDINDDMNGLDDFGEELFTDEFSSKVFNPKASDLRIVETKLCPDEHLTNVTKNIYELCKCYNGTYERFGAAINEAWIHSCELIIQNLNMLNTHKMVEEFLSNASDSVLETFHSCIVISLNFSLASQHQVPGCNLRHIKVGLRMVELSASSEHFMKWILTTKQLNLYEMLFQLLGLDLIPMPIKMSVARLLHCLLDTTEGFNKLTEFEGYKKIVNILESECDVRLMQTMKATIRKLHSFEILVDIKMLATTLYENVKMKKCEVEESDIKNLENLFTALKNSRKFFKVYSKKFLPIAAQFEMDPEGEVINLVSSYKANCFLESMILLWNLRQKMSSKLCGLMMEYLSIMTKNKNEMSYITDNIQLVNQFVKILFNSELDVNEESTKIYVSHKVATEIAFKIEAKYYLDCILHRQQELPDCLASLHALCVGHGRKHVLEFIAMEENLSIFLDLIDKEKSLYGQELHNIKQKSPVLNYCVDILDLVVRHCENLDYLKYFGNALLSLVKHHDIFEPSVSAILQELAVFLRPIEIKEVFTQNDIIALIDTVERSKEFLTTFPGDLIMSIRILQYLIIHLTEKEFKQLKHAYFVVQFYHADGVSLLMSILDKLTQYYDQPSVHSYLLGANQGTLLTQIVLPTVQLLRKIQVEVITLRNVNFRDVTAIETLMKTYTLMQAINSKSSSFDYAKTVQKEIVKILLTYTQSLTPDGMTTTNIHKSLWTQMIGEVIKFTLNGPYRFVPGLNVLSELLPLPLPVCTLSSGCNSVEGEIQRIVTERQLWSAHLHPQSHLISDMIQTFCTSSSEDLFQIIYKVCIQLSDLAPNMTLLVSKAVVDMVLLEPLANNVEGTMLLAQRLKFLAHLVRHPSVKVSVLSILNGKLAELMTNILSHSNDENADHVSCQMQVFLILHGLLDAEISMLFNSAQPPEQIISSGLPEKELIVQFSTDIVETFCKTTNEGLIFASVRSMILLSNHDATFSSLRKVLVSRIEKIAEKISSITQSFGTSKKHMTVAIDLLELLRVLMTTEPSETFCLPARTMTLSTPHLACLVNYKLEENKESSFLGVLCSKLKESTFEETYVKNDIADMESTIETLFALLKSDSNRNEEIQTDDSTETLPTPTIFKHAEGIVTQFSSRLIFCPTEHMEELNIDYWFHNVCEEDDILPANLSKLDVDNLVLQCLPSETNIGLDCKRLLTLSSSPQSNREKNLSATCFRTRRVEMIDSGTGRADKKIFNKCKYSAFASVNISLLIFGFFF